MALLNIQGISVGFGGPLLLDRADLRIERGERVCLVGRNGEGKSTLLKLIAGDILPDEGRIEHEQGTRVACLAQEVPRHVDGTVFDVVASGLGELGALLTAYHWISSRLAVEGGETLMAELERIQHALEAVGGWRMHQRVETVLSRLALAADVAFADLSGGLKRQVLLAKALVMEPDLLLLDEPTNHLDIQAIIWLEGFLMGYKGTVLFVTHDRVFLHRLATRIIEIDRGRLIDWPGDYDTYLQRKQAALETETRQQAVFDKKLAQGEAWIRQGIKARRTRNEGRVRALKAMRELRRARREHTGKVRMQVQDAERSGKLVIEAQRVSYRYAGQPLIQELSTTIQRGDKVGIIGPNGSGKTTLLQILLGKLAPSEGTVRLGTRLEVAYFDQLRAQLEEGKTVHESVAEGSDKLIVNGKPRHVISYLQDFLFPPARARSLVKSLSGGERNRLLLARLFSKPANVMVLDEPTNDLDVETLELLEELLLDYTGTLLLVTHDRALLNNVVTSTLVFEGKGQVNEYVGGYDDWLRARRESETGAAPDEHRLAERETHGRLALGSRAKRGGVTTKTGYGRKSDFSCKKIKAPTSAERPRPRQERQRKMSFIEQRELEALPQHIEALEAEQEQIHETMTNPGFYRQGGEQIAITKARLEALEHELAKAYQRWEILEGLQG